jgi:hypothetical protein
MQKLITDTTGIQDMYGEYSYGSRSFGSSVQTPANITATAISATPSQIPCPEGICTFDVSVTWKNTGGTDGSFVPNINIDGVPASPTYPSETLAGNNTSVTHGFTVSGLSSGDHTICSNPN